MNTPAVEDFQVPDFGAGSQQAAEKQEQCHAPIQERSHDNGRRTLRQGVDDNYCCDCAAAQQLQIRVLSITVSGGGGGARAGQLRIKKWGYHKSFFGP